MRSDQRNRAAILTQRAANGARGTLLALSDALTLTYRCGPQGQYENVSVGYVSNDLYVVFEGGLGEHLTSSSNVSSVAQFSGLSEMIGIRPFNRTTFRGDAGGAVPGARRTRARRFVRSGG